MSAPQRPLPLFQPGDRVQVIAGPDTGTVGVIKIRFGHRVRNTRFLGTMTHSLEYIYDVRRPDGSFLIRALAESEITPAP